MEIEGGGRSRSELDPPAEHAEEHSTVAYLFQSDSETMHANPQRPCLHWTALALLALSTLLSGGCAKFFHSWHYNPVTRSLHEHRLSYYHSPHSGRIIPKEHHQVPMVEFPCFGYESTCWHRWPEECGPCPVQGPEGMLLDGPYHGQIIEEVIGQPPAEGQPMPSAPGNSPPQPPVDEPADDFPSGDALPGAESSDTGLPSDLPVAPTTDDQSLLPRGSDIGPERTWSNQPGPASAPAMEVDRVEDVTGVEDFSVQPLEARKRPAIETPEVDLSDAAPARAIDTSAASEPIERGAPETAGKSTPAETSHGAAYVENSFVIDSPLAAAARDWSATPAATAAERLAQQENTAEKAGRGARRPQTPPSNRVARRSSRRVRLQDHPAPTELSTVTSATEPPQETESKSLSESLSPTESAPTSPPAAPVTTPAIPTRPVVASSVNNRAAAQTAIHRSGSSRRLSDKEIAETLPSFTIIPVLAAQPTSIAAPLQIQPGPGNELRFLSEEPSTEIRVADQSGQDDAPTLRFR